MDDRLRQAAREVYRNPELFMQQLDPITRERLFTSMTWQQLLDLVGSLDLDRTKLDQLDRVVGSMRSTSYYTVQGVDLRKATDEQLLELFRLVQYHEITPPKSRVPAGKHHMVRHFCWRKGLVESQ